MIVARRALKQGMREPPVGITCLLDICALTNDPNALIIDSPEKPGYWVRNSASTLWGKPEDLFPPDSPDEGYYGVRPYAMVDFETPPTIDGCVFQGQLSGYSYAIYDATGQEMYSFKMVKQ